MPTDCMPPSRSGTNYINLLIINAKKYQSAFYESAKVQTIQFENLKIPTYRDKLCKFENENPR